METTEPTLWQQLSPEQQTRIIAMLVRMLLQHLTQLAEATHDPA